MEQFTMFISPEQAAFESVRPALDTVLAENRLGPEYLSFEKRKQYWAIIFNSFDVVARVRSGSSCYLEVPTTPLVFSQAFKSLVQKPESSYTKIPLHSVEFIAHYEELLQYSLRKVVDKIPKEYDCCSRYLECSDAKICIHPDVEFSLNCGYRRIMRDGRIFYGKNRNI